MGIHDTFVCILAYGCKPFRTLRKSLNPYSDMVYAFQRIVLHDVCNAELSDRVAGERLELNRIDLLSHITDTVTFPVSDGVSQKQMKRILIDC